MACVDVSTDLWAHLVARADRDADGCLVWRMAKDRKGYGKLQIDGRHHLAHRLAYEAAIGPIPHGLHVDHLCRKSACIEPAHLEAVTPRVNTMRGENHVAYLAMRNSCDRGHPLSGDNVIVRANGARACRTCKRAYDWQWQRRRRQHVDRDGEPMGGEQ